MQINEIFLSIQGEGILTGLPTVFVRTKGCNLRCSYCDTKYSYDEGTEKSITEIITEIESLRFKRVCLTGGEPLLQDDSRPLIDCLLSKGYEVSLETNGSISLNKVNNHENLLISLDIKCPSSGSWEKMNLSNLKFLSKKDQVKFIIDDNADLEFACALVNTEKLSSRTNVFFNPVGGVKAENIVNEVLKRGMDVRVGLQIHKIIWEKDKRGV